MPAFAVTGSTSALAAGPSEAGFYGKVPTHGDFVGQRLPRSFLDRWDAWLSDAVQTSRTLMAGDWLPAYLSAPVWRFVLAPGLCAPAGMIGIVMPSVDRVGRYYPLTVATELVAHVTPVVAAVALEAWFAEAESHALAALDDGFDLDAFDLAIKSLSLPIFPRSMRVSTSNSSVRVALDGSQPLEALCPALLDGVLDRSSPPYSVWSVAEPEPAATAFLICNGLPDPATFPAFLDRQWQRWGWTDSAAPVMSSASF